MSKTNFSSSLTMKRVVGSKRTTPSDVMCMLLKTCYLFVVTLSLLVAPRHVNAEDGSTQTIVVQPWQIPSPTNPYPNLVARPGDVIRFFWTNTHNVYIHPSGSCEIQDRIFVGQTSPAQYTFTDADLGSTLTFACDEGSHCEFGMIFNVTIEADETSAPTIIPATELPSLQPSTTPSQTVTSAPITAAPTSEAPTTGPTPAPTTAPTRAATTAPTDTPTASPTTAPTSAPVAVPTTPAPTTVAPVTSAPVTSAPVVEPTTPAPTTMAPTTSAPVTSAPVVTPTTPSPTTTSPTVTPSLAPVTSAPVTSEPTGSGTSEPTTMSPTVSPAPPSGQPVSVTLTGLRMGMAGIDSFGESTQQTWSNYTGQFSQDSIARDFSDTVSDFSTLYEVKSFEVVPLRRKMTATKAGIRGDNNNDIDRLLQADSSVIVVYDQTMQYVTTDANAVSPELLASDPFATPNQKSEYVTVLATSPDPNLQMVSGVSDVDVPPQTPTSAPAASPTNAPTEEDSSPLSTPAIIGIACGGGALLIFAVLYFLYCRNRRGGDGTGGGSSKYQSDFGDDPPLQVSIREDEVSTLAGPAATGPPTYGDQSVATVDYDYSKAYGGGGSVSSAGGTFGSNTQNNQPSALDPSSAAATGAALGVMSDGGSSFEGNYRDPSANMKEEVMHIFAPPGKLGVVIDTPDDGAPVVHAVKDSSVIAAKIQVGDKLVAVDDEDVRSMTAIKVSKLISRKSANPSRKLTIVRTTFAG